MAARPFPEGAPGHGWDFYRYFPSKGELLAQAYSVQTRRNTEIIARIAGAELPPAEKLSAAIRGFAARAVKGRRLAYAMLAEPAAPEVEAARLEYHAAFVQIFGHIVQPGIGSGDFQAAAAEVMAACIAGAMREAFEQQLVDGGAAAERSLSLQRGRIEQVAQRAAADQVLLDLRRVRPGPRAPPRLGCGPEGSSVHLDDFVGQQLPGRIALPNVIPHEPVRQRVLSLPIPLRLPLTAQPELPTPVPQVVQRVGTRHLLDGARLEAGEGHGGSVTLIRRFSAPPPT